MPNDAKLGLVLGVTLVILVAILFARKDGAAPALAGTSKATPTNATKVAVSPPAPVPGLPSVPAKTKSRGGPLPRSHTVDEGESLMSLAVLYYGDAGQVSYLFRANQDRILSPERVPIGTVLRIPEAPAGLAGKANR